jgi:hypothetical protein
MRGGHVARITGPATETIRIAPQGALQLDLSSFRRSSGGIHSAGEGGMRPIHSERVPGSVPSRQPEGRDNPPHPLDSDVHWNRTRGGYVPFRDH